MSVRISALLDLDISAFRSGIDQVNTLLGRLKVVARTGDIGGGLKQLLGAGGLIQGFRAVLSNAQEARDRARELGLTINAGTAAVARYADAWDRVKRTALDFGTRVLGGLAMKGEEIGTSIRKWYFERYSTRNAAEVERTAQVSETAAAKADRLSSPEALRAAKDRGDKKRLEQDRKREEAARKDEALAGQIATAAQKREEIAARELPLQEQIARLEARRSVELARYNNDKLSSVKRAEALVRLAQIEGDLQARRADRERELTSEKEKQARLTEKRQRLEERVRDAREGVDNARAERETLRRDRLAFSLDEARGGTRGNSAARAAARGIERDEATARRLRDFGGSVTLFDSARQRNIQAGAEFFENRALASRQKLGGLNSAEQNPFAAADAALKAAGEKLSQAAADLAKVEVSVDVDS